ncbi:MAG: glycosyltransferase family 4 protein [Thermoanaerobaculia bacterium]
MLKRTVLHLRSSRSLAGPERHLLELLPGLAARGFTVEVALLYRRRPGDPVQHPLVGELAVAGILGLQIDDPDRAGRAVGRVLAERLRRGDVAALHGHDPKSDWVIARARDAQGSAVEPGKSRAPIRRLATLHLYTRTTLPLRLYRRLDLALVRRFDGVVAVTAALAAELAGGTRCRVIPNGIDGESLRARAAAALPALRRELAGLAGREAAPLLVAAGRLTRQKGFDVLLEALPALLTGHPGLLLCLAGEGPERAALAAQARRLELGDRVRFLGQRGDLAALFAAADLFVLPSRSEGSPYVLLEAMALGLPVVATAVGDVAETLGGEAAERAPGLVHPGDAVALAAAIRQRLRSLGETKGPAERARAVATSRRSAARMVEETAAFYAEVLQ